MIRTIVFDLGGVIFNIDKRQAIRRFNEAGFADAARYHDAFHQVGIFGELESGAAAAALGIHVLQPADASDWHERLERLIVDSQQQVLD